jgi:hypothetical protein
MIEVLEFGDGRLRILRKNLAESLAGTSLGDTPPPSSESIAPTSLLDLEQCNHVCNSKSGSQSSR